MAESDLPEDVRWLIRNHISSALELDILLAMRGRADAVTAADLARELRSNETVTASTFDKFTGAGLLERADDGYAYRPADARLARATDMLADTYARRRVSVIRFIFRRPSEGVSAFADAFKLRRDR